jgi:predicted DNA-binding transcriptional regulator AlpA
MDGSNSNTKNSSLNALPVVMERLGISRSAWYAGIKAGIYPQGLKLGKRSRRWTDDQIEQVIRGLST